MSDASIQCYDPQGRPTFDYRDAAALFVSIVHVPTGESLYQQLFPSLTGRNVTFLVSGVVRDEGITPPSLYMLYPNGVPQINAPMNPYAGYDVYIFAQ